MLFSKPELVIAADEVAHACDIDPSLICSVIEALSAWNPALIEQSPDPMQFNPALGVLGNNPQGRIGLMQITEQQAEELGYKEKGEALMEPRLNVEIGCKMLKRTLDQAGKQADRALLLMYGYSVVPLFPRIITKIPLYKKFLAMRQAMG